MLEPRLYPGMAAIANVYEEAKRYDADAAKVNPMELWDLHHIRRIDDTGFVKALYGQNINPRVAEDHGDPEYKREQERRQAEVIAAVKACGHLDTEDCGCH